MHGDWVSPTRLLAIRVQQLELVSDLLQLLAGATSNCPFEICGQVRGDVLRRVLPGVAYSSLLVCQVLHGWWNVVNKPVAPKTTRSYVRPCCLNPILKARDVVVEICQVKYVRTVKSYTVCAWVFRYGLTELAELQRN